MSVVGFDVGFQSCFIAVARQGGIEVVANEFSDRSTPACVSFGEKERSFGNVAKAQMVTNSKNTVWGWKRLLGRPFSDPTVQKHKEIFPYELVEGQNGSVGIQVNYLGETQVLSPQQVTAAMFTKLKTTAEVALKIKVTDCVINVPCYYTDVQRRALFDAAITAGLNVLRIMNDTAATALSYGIYKQDLPAPEEKSRNVVFVDMGHSDLQVCACAFNKGKLKMLACAADEHLGGMDFDLLLYNHFAEEFKKKYKVDANKKLKARLRLLAECEKMKKLMSANSTELPINLECFMDDKDVSGRTKRETLEQLGANVIERIYLTFRRLLEASKLNKDDIHSVEIVGGSTRVPAVKLAVKTVFGLEPSTTLNADEAVARGCALQCAILSPTFRVRDFSVTDVQPYPILLKWEGASMDEESEMEIFERFHPAPFSKMLTFYRNQKFSLEAKYSDAKDIPFPSVEIGSFTVCDVKPQEGEENAKVKVKVRVNGNGIFTIASAVRVEKVEKEVEAPKEPPKEKKEKTEEKKADAKDAKEEPMDVENGPANQTDAAKATNEEQATDVDQLNAEKTADQPEKKTMKIISKSIELPIKAHVKSLTRDQLNLLIEKEGHMIQQDKLEKERADAKNAVEEYVYDMRDKLATSLEPYIKEPEREKFSALLTSTEDWLYEEGEDQNKQVYLDKLAELQKLGNPVKHRFAEAQTRPSALNELGKGLMLVRKAVDAYAAGDEMYNHIEKAEMEKVSKCLQEKSAWYEQHLNTINAQALNDDPAVSTNQIQSQQSLLESTCRPILTKPKPKVEPPKEEVSKDDAAKSSDKKPAATAPNDVGDSHEKPESETSTESKIDMELD